jgi:LDH2 family malate/lactate/ureidoglycolate dehydrogenase
LTRYDPKTVREQAAGIARAAGVPAEDAAILADSLVDADIHGISTHGISRLDIYVRRIQKGLIDPTPDAKTVQTRPSVLVVDAGNGLGQVQAWKVLTRLIPMARETGVATATIRNSQHFGALAYYCERAAREGMILLATSNAEPSMSPDGGCQAFFGTNPIAASFPTGKGFHVRIDLATSLVARGNIVAAKRKGEPIPLGWALDPEGNPTTDAGQALLGTVLTMAGHKGYALALMVEIFSSVLSGSAVGPAIGSMYKDTGRKQDAGHFFCLLDISAFMDLEIFKGRIDQMIDGIKACRKRPGVSEILIPGEPARRRAAVNRQNGIPIGEETLREIRVICEELKVPYILTDIAQSA